MLGSLLCVLNRHVPFGRQADWDGEQYIAKCSRCGARIRRLRKGAWRRHRADPGT